VTGLTAKHIRTNRRVEIVAFVPFATQSIPRQVAAVFVDSAGYIKWDLLDNFVDARRSLASGTEGEADG
jgi:hypothetical protein